MNFAKQRRREEADEKHRTNKRRQGIITAHHIQPLVQVNHTPQQYKSKKICPMI